MMDVLVTLTVLKMIELVATTVVSMITTDGDGKARLSASTTIYGDCNEFGGYPI